MQSENHMTNQLGLIEMIPITFLGRLKNFILPSVPTGYSLEIFGSGRYLASVSSEDMGRMSNPGLLLQADTILKVNLGFRHQTFRGILRSSDGLRRAYEIDLLLHVSNAALFALQYLQKSDPIFLSQKKIMLQLELYAQGRNHNSMSEADIRNIAESDFSRSLQQHCGISVDQITRVYLQPASSYGEIQEIQQRTMVEEVRLNDQAHLERLRLRNEAPLQQMRDEQEIAFRVRDIRVAEMTDQYRNRQRISDAIGEGTADRIRDQFRRGYSLEDIRNENPEIEGLLQPGTQGRPDRQLAYEPHAQLPERTRQATPPAPTPAQFSVEPRAPKPSADDEVRGEPGMRIVERRRANSTPPEQDTDTIYAAEHAEDVIDAELTPVPAESSPPAAAAIRVTSFREGQRTRPVQQPSAAPAGDPLAIAQLGIELVRVTEAQRSELPEQVAHTVAFVVQYVTEESPAKRANILVGDFLMEIADQPVVDEASLLQALNRVAASRAIKIRVLRENQIVDVEGIRLT